MFPNMTCCSMSSTKTCCDIKSHADLLTCLCWLLNHSSRIRLFWLLSYSKTWKFLGHGFSKLWMRDRVHYWVYTAGCFSYKQEIFVSVRNIGMYRVWSKLPMKLGNWETKGVTKDLYPKTGKADIAAYGDHIQSHKRTFVMATLAILTSALSSLSLPADLRLSTFIFLAWALRAASWATTALTME